MTGHRILSTPNGPTSIEALQRRLSELERKLDEQRQAQYDQRRQLAQARVHAAVLEITNPRDLCKITGRIASELKELGVRAAGVGLNLIDEYDGTLTAYDIYDEELEYQDVQSADFAANQQLIEYWRRGRVWERLPDDDFRQIAQNRPYYKPALIIDAPFVRGTLAVGLAAGEIGANTHLIELLQAFCASLDLAFFRIGETAQNQVLQHLREDVWKMQGVDDLGGITSAVEEGLRVAGVPFHNCSINLIDYTHSPPRCIVLRKMAGKASWNEAALLPAEVSKLLVGRQKNPEPIYRHDLEQADFHDERLHLQDVYGETVRSVLDVPFSRGSLGVNSTRPNAFSDEHVQFLRQLSRVLSDVFHRRDDLTRLEEQHRLLLSFHEIGRTLLSSLDLDKILDTLTEQAVQAGLFRSLVIALIDREAGLVRCVRAQNRKPDGSYGWVEIDAVRPLDSQNLFAFVAREGETRAIEGWDERFDSPGEKPENYTDKVSYFIPVKQRDQVVAVLATGSTYAERETTLRRIEAMQPLLDLFAIAIEHAQLYREISESRENLRQSQKMDLIGQLAGGVAHDFNNMLTAILGSTSSLLLQARSESEREELEIILQAGKQAATVSQQLLAFSRRQLLNPVEFNLNEQIESSVGVMRRLLGERIHLHTALDTQLDSVWVDPGQMNQVLLNLVVNGRDAMGGNGRLTIRTQNRYLTPEAAHRLDDTLAGGSYVTLAVEDEGCGMDAATLERIFEPFFTTKDAGTGLGLSTVYGIVKQSSGHVCVTSTPQKGSLFEVLLPGAATQGKTARVQTEEKIYTREHATILIAEDEDIVRRTVGNILRHSGYETIEANSGAQALQLAAEREIDCLLTDVVMPGMDGPSLATELRSQRPGLRVLYMSGHIGELFAEDVEQKADSFIQKPFTAQALVQAVRQALLQTP